MPTANDGAAANVVPFRAALVEGGSPQAFGGGSGSGGGLEVRVAKLEVDIDYIKRDVVELKGDTKATIAALSRLEATVARIETQLKQLATREWVMWRLFGAFLLFLGALGAVVGYAPRLWALLGTLPR